jgi:hypothetical protein
MSLQVLAGVFDNGKETHFDRAIEAHPIDVFGFGYVIF